MRWTVAASTSKAWFDLKPTPCARRVRWDSLSHEAKGNRPFRGALDREILAQDGRGREAIHSGSNRLRLSVSPPGQPPLRKLQPRCLAKIRQGTPELLWGRTRMLLKEPREVALCREPKPV
jgi:hypothetical protein